MCSNALQLLLYKTEYCKRDINANDRNQYVRLDNVKSSSHAVTCEFHKALF